MAAGSRDVAAGSRDVAAGSGGTAAGSGGSAAGTWGMAAGCGSLDAGIKGFGTVLGTVGAAGAAASVPVAVGTDTVSSWASVLWCSEMEAAL